MLTVPTGASKVPYETCEVQEGQGPSAWRVVRVAAVAWTGEVLTVPTGASKVPYETCTELRAALTVCWWQEKGRMDDRGWLL